MNKKTWAAFVIGWILLAYIITAYMVFALRHPWATDTQRFLHTWDALCFRQVPEEKR